MCCFIKTYLLTILLLPYNRDNTRFTPFQASLAPDGGLKLEKYYIKCHLDLMAFADVRYYNFSGTFSFLLFLKANPKVKEHKLNCKNAVIIAVHDVRLNDNAVI